MIYILNEINPFFVCLFCGLFTLIITALGAFMVFFINKQSEKAKNLYTGIGGGIMLAASFFSLLLPAINHAKVMFKYPIIPCAFGFFIGTFVLVLLDIGTEKICIQKNTEQVIPRFLFIFILAITIHNIPEGMSIGVTAARMFDSSDTLAFRETILLTLGIAIQNFPEGFAVSMPLFEHGLKKKNAFFIGSLTAIVEPISAILGLLLISKIKALLPFALSMASGAMIYVVLADIVPSTTKKETRKYLNIGFILGFILMMILDVIF